MQDTRLRFVNCHLDRVPANACPITQPHITSVAATRRASLRLLSTLVRHRHNEQNYGPAPPAIRHSILLSGSSCYRFLPYLLYRFHLLLLFFNPQVFATYITIARKKCTFGGCAGILTRWQQT